MQILITPLDIAAFLVTVIGSYTDIRTGKIPNKLTFPAAALGIAARAAYLGYMAVGDRLAAAAGGALSAVLGWLLAVFVMSAVKYFLKQMGHGDTKLMAAVGAFVGPATVSITFLYFCLVYGLYTLIRLLSSLPWKELFIAQQLKEAGGEAPPVDLSRVNEVRKQLIPVAPLIATGFVVAVLLREPTFAYFGITGR